MTDIRQDARSVVSTLANLVSSGTCGTFEIKNALAAARRIEAAQGEVREGFYEKLWKDFAGDAVAHDSDCAVNNAPALPTGACDCWASRRAWYNEDSGVTSGHEIDAGYWRNKGHRVTKLSAAPAVPDGAQGEVARDWSLCERCQMECRPITSEGPKADADVRQEPRR